MAAGGDSTTLLLGAEGMLGRAFQRELASRGVPFVALSRTDLDLADSESVAGGVPHGTPLVINCAAYSDVDGAETDEAAATRVNGEGAGLLAAACRDAGATLLHFSTDYVFDGSGSEPYLPDHPRAPINAYGRSKALGEELIERSGCDHLVVRTSWLYAPWGKNFVLAMRRLLAERDTVRVVDDQHGRPTSAEHLAGASLDLLGAGRRGMAHITDGGQCTWCGLSREIAEHVPHAAAIEPCTTEEFPRPAERPRYSVLDLAATERAIGPMPCWRDHVRAVLATLESETSATAGAQTNG